MANKPLFALNWQPCGGDCRKHVDTPRSLPTAASSTEAWQTCANPQKLPADTNAGRSGSSKRPRVDRARTTSSKFCRTSMKRRWWNPLVVTGKRASRRVGEPRSSQCRGPHCCRNCRCRACRQACVASPEKAGGDPFGCVSAKRH